MELLHLWIGSFKSEGVSSKEYAPLIRYLLNLKEYSTIAYAKECSFNYSLTFKGVFFECI